FAAIWAMFGIANQMLAAIALAIVSAYLVNEGRSKYLWVTIVPMCVVITTTSTAGVTMLSTYWNTVRTQWGGGTKISRDLVTNGLISAGLTLAMLASAYVVIVAAMWRCLLKGAARE